MRVTVETSPGPPSLPQKPGRTVPAPPLMPQQKGWGAGDRTTDDGTCDAPGRRRVGGGPGRPRDRAGGTEQGQGRGGGLTMMAMPEKSTADTNCQSLGAQGRRSEPGPRPPQAPGSLPIQLRAQGWLVLGERMRGDGLKVNRTQGKAGGQGPKQPLP